MKDLGHAPFLTVQREFEPLVDRPVPQHILEEYIKNDQDRLAGGVYPVVYDYIE